MFDHVLTIVLAAAVGALIAFRYTRTRSFLAAWTEHALYGQLVFTVGLGRYFFTGVGFSHH